MAWQATRLGRHGMQAAISTICNVASDGLMLAPGCQALRPPLLRYGGRISETSPKVRRHPSRLSPAAKPPRPHSLHPSAHGWLPFPHPAHWPARWTPNSRGCLSGGAGCAPACPDSVRRRLLPVMWLPSTFTAQLPPSYSPHPVPALGSITPDQAPLPSSSLIRLCASSAGQSAILVLERRWMPMGPSAECHLFPAPVSHVCLESRPAARFTTSFPR
ncbi:hypothetical protein BU16DRAFT_101605 [Lophium mytilinum]|uniref:Uncharacterized protein n=1 Tax=Lophium mytilinum TaxID=390894 RepID=A0A6A6QHX7_9PEZI|nr:hypothetical protein BU16DRAFT_101605 [Lophium mytilinum]